MSTLAAPSSQAASSRANGANGEGAGLPRVSVLIPVFNEVGSLERLHGELTAVFRAWERPYELVFVDDGSVDGSGPLLEELAERDGHVRVVHLCRNFGQTAALSAGLDHSRGSVVVPIDADLQNAPADIPALVEKLDEGYDVVSGWRRNRRDAALTRTLPSRAANGLISLVSGIRLHDYGCTLKAYRREVIDGVRLYGEMHRFLPLYAHMQGGRLTEMAVDHRPRRSGESKYGLSRIYKVLLDLLLVKFLASYASKPIYVFGGFGLVCLVLSLATLAGSFFFKFAPVASWQKDFVETPLPIATGVLVLVGFLALLQGLLAEMLVRTYFESQGKRTYRVRSAGSPGGDKPAGRPIAAERAGPSGGDRPLSRPGND